MIYTHTKEMRVRNMINAHFDGFIHDAPMWIAGCNCDHRRRVDHRKLIQNVMLAVETDEFGHRGYDARDEEIRYDDLVSYHTGSWIFIRFNPDGNPSVDFDDKLDTLREEMEAHIERIESGVVNAANGFVEIHKLFF
jgi:hypothetical protein